MTTSGADSSITDRPGGRQRRLLFPWVLISAALMTAAFPPLDLGFLAWVGLVPLLYALAEAARPRKAFGLGYLFGLTHWGWTIVWIGATVTNWAHTPLGWIAWVLLTMIKSLWFGLFGFCAWWIAHRTEGHARAAGLAAAWTVVEWLRCQTMVAMPWSLIGYTQYRYLPIIQAADIGGVYLISFAIAWMNAGLVGVQAFRRSGVQGQGQRGAVDVILREPQATEESGGRKWLLVMPPVGLLLALLAYGGFRLSQRYDGPTAPIALMQPNMRSERGAAESTARDLATIQRMTQAAAPGHPVALIWPETIAPTDAVNNLSERSFFGRMATEANAFTVVGTGYTDEKGRPYNSAAYFAPDGKLIGRYDKRWLVPMGEWIPLRSILPFGDVFHFPKYDVVSGTTEQPFEAGPIRMSILICYESVFPILSRSAVNHGANLLVSITNDSWAGESCELQQHLAMTAMRAVETRRSVASAATTGVTCLIDPHGRIEAVPPYSERVLLATPKLLTGRTLYVICGDTFVLLCFLLAAACIAGLFRPRAGPAA